MYDIKPLEAEWKKYKQKKQKPWYIAGLIFSVLLIVVILFFGKMNIDFSTISSQFQFRKIENISNTESQVFLNESLNTLDVATVSVKPIVPLEQKSLQPVESKIKVKTSPKLLVDIPILDEVKQETIQSNADKTKQKVQIDIVETSSVTAYEDVEKRFFLTHDIDDALFLAKSYYEKELYGKAEYWALEANKIDETVEDSLLIFAKAKAKMGHKNEAISILTNYISKTSSTEAKNVLSRVENDTL